MMGMTEFVWRLHGGLKGYSRAVLRDWAVWLIAGVLVLFAFAQQTVVDETLLGYG